MFYWPRSSPGVVADWLAICPYGGGKVGAECVVAAVCLSECDE